MSVKCSCGCMCTWFSGFFAMPAIVHLIRIIAGWDLVLKGEPMTMKTSWIVFIVGAILAILFGYVGCKKSKETGTTGSACC